MISSHNLLAVFLLPGLTAGSCPAQSVMTPPVLSSMAALQVVRFQPMLLPGAFPSQVHGFVCSLFKFLQVFVCLLFLPEWVLLQWQSCPWVVFPQFDIIFKIDMIIDWHRLLKRTSPRTGPSGVCLELTWLLWHLKDSSQLLIIKTGSFIVVTWVLSAPKHFQKT